MSSNNPLHWLDSLIRRLSWRDFSVRKRLTVWYTLVLSLMLLLFGVVLYAYLGHNLNQEIDQGVTNQAAQVVRSIQVVGEFPLPLRQVVLPDVDVFATPDTYLQVVNNNGEVIARSGNLGSQLLPMSRDTLLYAVKGKAFFETLQIGDQRLRIYNQPLIYNHNPIGILQVGRSLAPVDKALARLGFFLFVGGSFTVLLAGLLGWALAGMALQPIHHLIQATEEIQEAADLDRRIAYQGPADEIGVLTATMNDMLARLHNAYQTLEENIAAQKRFVADASHELRTPLTTIRGNIELLQKMGDADPEGRREIMADITGETERMTRLVNDLLALARADAGFSMEMQAVGLAPFLEDLNRQVLRLPGEAEYIGAAAPGEIQLWANPDYLRQLFLILIDNAFKYTPAAGRIWLTIERKPSLVGITVHDNGPGIAPEDQPKIFQRFFRADRARVGRGTGLGLSIARWIAEQHGGNLELKSTPGVGSAFTVWLKPVEQA